MVAGSTAGGRRVAHSLAAKVTRIDHLEGFLANIVTAGVVIARAGGGLPMSTTYVALSAIVGAGARPEHGAAQKIDGASFANSALFGSFVRSGERERHLDPAPAGAESCTDA